MKKIKITLLVFLMFFAAISTTLCGCAENDKEKPVQESATAKVDKSGYIQFHDFFTPAFQLIWNDFSDKFVKGKVEFVAGNPQIADYFNERRLNESMISKKDLYKTCAKQTYSTKRTIEKNLKKKFNEKSKLLDSIEWYKKTDDNFILYAMFKKDILFAKSFVELAPSSFNKSEEQYKYFGVTTKAGTYSNVVMPIYYKNENNFAVRIASKTGDEIILATTKSKEPVFKIWDTLYKTKIATSNKVDFDNDSEIKIPQIDFKKSINYREFIGKQIKGCDFIINTALEDIEFSLDKDGAKIRNEAVMGVNRMALMPENPKKKYYFDKPFIIFIRSKDSNTPYFALKVKDTQYLIIEK